MKISRNLLTKDTMIFMITSMDINNGHKIFENILEDPNISKLNDLELKLLLYKENSNSITVEATGSMYSLYDLISYLNINEHEYKIYNNEKYEIVDAKYALDLLNNINNNNIKNINIANNILINCLKRLEIIDMIQNNEDIKSDSIIKLYDGKSILND